MITFRLTVLFLFLVCLASFAVEDSPFLSFIGDALKSDLQKGGAYPAHFPGEAHIELECVEDSAFFRVIACTQREERLRIFEDDFKAGCELIIFKVV